MKVSRKAIYNRKSAIPRIKFEDQKLTSFAGLVIFEKFFRELGLKEKLARCFSHVPAKHYFRHDSVVMLLVVHLLLGYRRLGQSEHYREDPMVKRLLGMDQLPSPATVSRMMQEFDAPSVENVQRLSRDSVLEDLRKQGFSRVTLDFDGSVLSTKRSAEGSAVGFNKKKKGARSYYPLFCCVAQTGQVLDVLHRTGNVHDSNGAIDFIIDLVETVRQALPGVKIEVRMDSAFFSDAVIGILESLRLEYTVSVPFERFTELKRRINQRKFWHRLLRSKDRAAYFETPWRPTSWERRRRFLFIRTRTAERNGKPLQLDLFEPKEEGFEFKAVVTNKKAGARKVVKFHEGRGQQENIYSELKSQGGLDYVPCRKWNANKIYLLSGLMAHNLCRRLQMQTSPTTGKTTEKRAPHWLFQGIGTLRRKFIQQAGRLTRPEGKLTLTLCANEPLKRFLKAFMEA